MSSSSASNNTWTPFECFPFADQTPSGLLRLEETEVEVLQRSNVQLRSAMASSASSGTAEASQAEPLGPPIGPDGRVDATWRQSNSRWVDRTDSTLMMQLTTHRLVLWQITQSQRVARFLHLSHVIQCSLEKSSSLFSSTKKILLNTYLGDLFLVLPNNLNPTEVLAVLQKTLERQEWTKSDPTNLKKLAAASKRNLITSRKVGVDAILAKSKLQQQHAQTLTDQALAAQDAEELIQEATELTKMIRKYVATLDRSNETASSSAGAGGDDGMDASSQQELVRLLQDMGMTSALSKQDSSNDAYYETIARQLADLLLPKMDRLGGVITLTDVYCLLNRARASNLLSPEDLLQATHALGTLQLGLRLRTFASGLVVLQDARLSDQSLAELLRDACAAPDGATTSSSASDAGGLTALEVAHLLKTTPLLAQEQLWAAEQMGYLVRDEQLQVVRFFPNRFDEWFGSLLGNNC